MGSLNDNFAFEIGQTVCLRSDPGIRGPVVSRSRDGHRCHYRVSFFSEAFSFSESQLLPVFPKEGDAQNFPPGRGASPVLDIGKRVAATVDDMLPDIPEDLVVPEPEPMRDEPKEPKSGGFTTDANADAPGALRYLAKGESAIVVCTDGNQFQFDAQGNGYTGNWYLKGPQYASKVMVFLRHFGKPSEIYLADIVRMESGLEVYRTRIHFKNCVLCGEETMTWNQFSGVPIGKKIFSLQVIGR